MKKCTIQHAKPVNLEESKISGTTTWQRSDEPLCGKPGSPAEFRCMACGEYGNFYICPEHVDKSTQNGFVCKFCGSLEPDPKFQFIGV